MDSTGHYNESEVRAAVEKIINRRIEAHKRNPNCQAGPIEAYLFKGDKVIVCPDVPNSSEFPGMAAIWQMVNMVQADAFLVCVEAYMSEPTGPKLGPRLSYGKPHLSKQEVLHFAVRSKNGAMKFDRTYGMIRNNKGRMVGLQLLIEGLSVCPWWGENDGAEAA